jgi:hypothetical protein
MCEYFMFVCVKYIILDTHNFTCKIGYDDLRLENGCNHEKMIET